MGLGKSPPISRTLSPLAVELDSDRPVISPISKLSPLEETLFDEAKDTRFNLEEGAKTFEPPKGPLRYPKRYSSLTALDDQQQQQQQQQSSLASPAQTNNSFTRSAFQQAPSNPHIARQQEASFYDSNSSCESEAGTIAPQTVAIAPDGKSTTQKPVRERAEELSSEDVAYRSKQPLPPLPIQVPAKKPSKTSLKANSVTPNSMLSPVSPIEKWSSPRTSRSRRSSRSSRSGRKSIANSSSDNLAQSSVVSDTTWEDDVDFVYQQEAESTCDFNWNVISRPLDSTPPQDAVVHPSSSFYHAQSPDIASESGTGSRYDGTNGSKTSVQYNSSSETIAERRKSNQLPKRGSSVGHRGFLAARKNSADLSTKLDHAPTPLHFTPNSAPVSVLSPVFSVTGAEEDTPKTRLTPGVIHFSQLDVNTDYLSDPESYRNSDSSKHRKSSSYGSYESISRPVIAPSQNTTRWSIASSSSAGVPDLTHSRPKSKSSLSKNMFARPLESLPGSPPLERDTEGQQESAVNGRPLQTEPPRNSFMMRRPEVAADRTVMQAAGRAVQRHRPATPSRSSQLLELPERSVRESMVGGPEWI